MIGFASAVAQDVPPFMLVDGNPLAVRGFNVVGLRRRDFSAERGSRPSSRCTGCCTARARRWTRRAPRSRRCAAEVPEAAADVALMSDFLASATRGIAR